MASIVGGARRWAVGVCILLAAGGLTGCSSNHPARSAEPPSTSSTTSPARGTGGPPGGEQATVLCSSGTASFALLAVTGRLGAPELVVTDDFRHFATVTPSPNLVATPSFGMFTGGTCPTPTDLWVIAASPDHSAGWLLHSTNRGRSWVEARPAWTGSAGVASVAFSDVGHGFLVSGDPAANGNAALAFARTTDGGTTWTPVPLPVQTLDDLAGGLAFATGTDGFAVPSLSPGSAVDSTLLTTSDAGSTWTAALQPAVAGPTALFSTPSCFGGQAILPIVVVHAALSSPPPGQTERGTADVVVDQSSDGGASWRSWPTVALGATVSLQSGSRPLGTPSVSPSSPSTVWIAYATTAGRVSLRLTTDGGASWSTPPGHGLPTAVPPADPRSSVAQPVSIQAVSGGDAIVTVQADAGSSPVSYLTVDGGSHWSPITAGTLAD